jgi:membrane-bound ClpP family serine protease
MKPKREVNYRALFILGLAFIPIGIATDNTAFIAVGGLFMIIFAANQVKANKENKPEELEQ